MDWFSVIKLDWDPNVPFHELTSRRCCTKAKEDFNNTIGQVTSDRGAKLSRPLAPVEGMECDDFKEMLEANAKKHRELPNEEDEFYIWQTILDRWRDCENRGYGQ